MRNPCRKHGAVDSALAATRSQAESHRRDSFSTSRGFGNLHRAPLARGATRASLAHETQKVGPGTLDASDLAKGVQTVKAH